jgi:hypothetical protein
MGKISNREAEVRKIAQLADTESLRSLEQIAIRLSAHQEISTRRLEEDRYKAMVSWLSALPYYDHHQRLSEVRIRGTGDWLIRHQEFVEWQFSSNSSVFLLEGITGSGKTTLCSTVVDYFQANASRVSGMAPFSYFYCANPDFVHESVCADGVLRTILGQLCIDRTARFKVQDILASEYERQSAIARIDSLEPPRLTARRCVELILELALDEPLTIFIDAIDSIRSAVLHVLITSLNKIVTDASNVIKIFLTCRTNGSSVVTLKPQKHVIITSMEARPDMEIFVASQIDTVLANRLPGENTSPRLKEVLIESLLENAGEM